MLAQLSVKSAPAKTHGIAVVPGGTLISQSRTIELKTRSRTTWDPNSRTKVQNTFDWGESYLQMYLSQTEHHFLGWHDRGTFGTVEKRTLAALKRGKEGKAQEANLRKLAAALRAIVQLIKDQGEGKLLSLVCDGGVLTLRARTTGAAKALPDDVLALFATV